VVQISGEEKKGSVNEGQSLERKLTQPPREKNENTFTEEGENGVPIQQKTFCVFRPSSVKLRPAATPTQAYKEFRKSSLWK